MTADARAAPGAVPGPEMHRPIAVDRIGPHGHAAEIKATAPECVAIAVRLLLPAVASLRCHFQLHPQPGGRIAVSGTLNAVLSQICVVTLEPFSAKIEEKFRIRFVPEGRESDDPDPESDDEVPYSGAEIDLGEAAIEQLALALDPYPRAPGATLPDILDDGMASPFAGLAGFGSKNQPS